MRLQRASNDLMEPIRTKCLGLLDSRLADDPDLQTQIKQKPCRVKDPYFSGQLRLFDDINEEVEHNLDTIPERQACLRGTLEETARALAAKSALLENPVAVGSGRDQVASLADSLASFRGNVRQAISPANEVGDAVTASVLTQVSRGVDRWLWMVQANLQQG